MSESSKKNTAKLLRVKDLDFISGGATVVDEIGGNLRQTSGTQKCNCGLFEPNFNGVNLNICDNCKWAQAPYQGSRITFCSKQNT